MSYSQWGAVGGIEPNPRGDCILCGRPEKSYHRCSALGRGPATTCALGHDKRGKRNCPTCKAAYDRARHGRA